MTLKIENLGDIIEVVSGLGNFKIGALLTVDAPSGYSEDIILNAISTHPNLVLIGGTILNTYTYDINKNNIVDLVDGMDGLSATLDDLSTTVDGLSTTTDGLSTTVDGLSTTVDGLSTTVDGLVSFSIPGTDRYYIDGNLGDDSTPDGSLSKPYKTIQACLDMIGQPVNHIDAMRTIHIYVSGKTSAVESISGGQTFSGCYSENLTVPSRRITIFGYGVKLGDNGAGSGGGNILKEYSTGRRFGATSSELRPCLTLVGLAEVRDNHQRLRNGFHVGGTCRTSILTRSFDSIQGDGSNKITVHVAAGQYAYPITVSNYPTTPYIRISVQNSLYYSGTYDITEKIDDTTFVATKVSGTNLHTEIETSGRFFESDSAGASGLSHDSCFLNTYMQGAYTCDDGTVNGAAPTAGTEVLYSEGSRFYTGVEGRSILLQRWINTTLAGASIINSSEGMNNCSISGTLTLSTFTYATDDMGFIANRFNSAVPITVSSAGQTVRMDAITYKSFRDAGCTWVTNTPTIDLLGRSWDSGVWASRPTTCLQTGQMYLDTGLKKPYWYNSGDSSWYDATGVVHI